MSGTQTGDLKPVAARAGPPWWARVLVYGFMWLPMLVVVLVFAPRFEPIFKRLEEQGELPQLTRWLMAFDRLDTSFFYLPALLLALAVSVVDEVVVRTLRRRARGNLWSWLWVAAVALAAIPAGFLVVSGLLLPVFKMSSTVR
jgi:hypothetical protein